VPAIQAGASPENPRKHSRDLESEEMEMGVKSVPLGAAWKEADEELRDRFETEYLDAYEKREVFERYIDTLGAAAMLDYFELRNSRCHAEVHDLGKVIYARSVGLSAALASCGNRCTNACMHGAVGEAFGGSDFENITRKMTSFCSQGEMAHLHKLGNCSHAIGHALMIVSGHDIGKSLAGCSEFERPGMDYYCATGVFMEYRGWIMSQIERGEDVDRPSPHFPCDLHFQFPAACYRYMLDWIGAKTDGDTEDLIEVCVELSGRRRLGCFHGLGATYSRSVADSPALMPIVCRAGSSEDQIMCIEGVIEKLASFSEERAEIVCATLEGKNAEVCRAGASEKMYRLDKPSMRLYRP
jgi:hypothetical protein